MKKTTILLTSVLFLAGALLAEDNSIIPAPLPAGSSDLVKRETPPPPPETNTVDAYNALKKERDDLKIQVSGSTAEIAALKARIDLLTILAERNELAFRLGQKDVQALQLQNQQLQQQLAVAAQPPSDKKKK